MTRQGLTTVVLMTSAGMMAVLLVLAPESRVVYGDGQVNNPDYVVMTGRAVENGDDSVMVLENKSGKLLTYEYRMDATGVGRFLLTNPIDLNRLEKPRP